MELSTHPGINHSTLTICLHIVGANTPMLETQVQGHVVESFVFDAMPIPEL
jgi:hypothetical protein